MGRLNAYPCHHHELQVPRSTAGPRNLTEIGRRRGDPPIELMASANLGVDGARTDTSPQSMATHVGRRTAWSSVPTLHQPPASPRNWRNTSSSSRSARRRRSTILPWRMRNAAAAIPRARARIDRRHRLWLHHRRHAWRNSKIASTTISASPSDASSTSTSDGRGEGGSESEHLLLPTAKRRGSLPLPHRHDRRQCPRTHRCRHRRHDLRSDPLEHAGPGATTNRVG